MADICDPDQPSKPRPLVAPKPSAKDRLAWLASTVSEGIQSRYWVTPSELAWSSPNRLEGVPEPELWRVFLSTLYRPADDVLDELKTILPALGIDLAGLDRPAQPYRMPGFARETGGGFTGLLWLDQKDAR